MRGPCGLVKARIASAARATPPAVWKRLAHSGLLAEPIFCEKPLDRLAEPFRGPLLRKTESGPELFRALSDDFLLTHLGR